MNSYSDNENDILSFKILMEVNDGMGRRRINFMIKYLGCLK